MPQRVSVCDAQDLGQIHTQLLHQGLPRPWKSTGMHEASKEVPKAACSWMTRSPPNLSALGTLTLAGVKKSNDKSSSAFHMPGTVLVTQCGLSNQIL